MAKPGATTAPSQWLLHMPPGVNLKGIRPAEDYLYERLEEEAGEDFSKVETEPHYETVPEWYIVGLPDHWPLRCEHRRCVSCTLTFQGMPWIVPAAIKSVEVPGLAVPDETAYTQAFQTDAVVCSPNCGMTYIDEKFSGERAAQIKEMLEHFYYAVTGKRAKHIPPAPPRTALKAYGGYYSNMDFWEHMAKLATETKLSARQFQFPSIDVEVELAPDGWDAAERMIVPAASDFPELANDLSPVLAKAPGVTVCGIEQAVGDLVIGQPTQAAMPPAPKPVPVAPQFLSSVSGVHPGLLGGLLGPPLALQQSPGSSKNASSLL